MKTLPAPNGNPRMSKTVARLGLVIVLAAIIAAPFFSSSSASSLEKPFQTSLTNMVRSLNSSEAPAVPLFSDLSVRQLLGVLPVLPHALTFIPQAAPVETVAVFQSNCTTPATTFTLGQQMCAKISGNPLGSRPTQILRRLAIVNPGGFIVAKADVNSNPQTLLFTLPSTATSQFDVPVDNRGNWSVNSIDTRGGLVTSAVFSVTDPAENVADLAILKVVSGDTELSAGSNVRYSIFLENFGPNAAAAVSFTDDVPANTTFVSESHSDASFTCTSPAAGASSGTTTCTTPSLAKGARVEFTLTYNVNPSTPVKTLIANTVDVTTTTTQRSTSNDSSTAEAIVADNGATEVCTLTCPANKVVTANTTNAGQPGAFVTYGAASADGSCGAVTNNPASGSFFTVGTHTVTSTAQAGPTCSFTVKVVDTPAPTISCPTNKVATAGNDGTATVAVGTPTFTASGGGTVTGVRTDSTPAVLDEEGNVVTPAVEIPLTDPYPTGITGITWTVTDADGRTATCQQTITVNAICLNDNERPTITAPANITVSTGSGNTSCSVALDDELGQANANDNCSVIVTISGIPAGNLFPIGSTTLTYTATDPSGNTNLTPATQVVTVIDDTPPSIAAPPDATYVCMTEVPAGNANQATRGVVLDEDGNPLPPGPPFDNCGTPTVTMVETNNGGAGSVASPRIITRTFTATDGATPSNSASAVQTITVADGVIPTITLNGANPITVECHTSFTDPGATAHDNCSADFAATATSNVNANAVGSYTIVYTAQDPAGNQATSVSRTVNVVDTTKPVITINGASAVTVECHTSYTDAGASASDSCDTSVPVVTSGSVNVNTPGTYTLTYNAADDSGNAANAVTRTVTVVDTTLPVITLNSYAPSMWPPNHKYTTFQLTQFVTGASDTCDLSIDLNDVVIEKVTSDELENSGGDGNTLNDIVIAANCKSVDLRSERNGGGNGRVYTITFKVTDISGRTGRATAKVRVPPNSGAGAVEDAAAYTVNGICP
jgi:uncharacterized repeat protein (TIGR01451 family)